MNTSRAETLRRTATKVGARSHPTQVLDSTLCAPPRGHTFSCAPHSGHMTLPSPFKFAMLHCRPVLQAGVADCSATMFQSDWHCSGCLPMRAPSSECGDMLQIHSCVFSSPKSGGGNPEASAWTALGPGPLSLIDAGPQYFRSMRQFARCNESL